MAKRIGKWIIGLMIAGLILAEIVLVLVLNPILMYANRTGYNDFIIYHEKPIDTLIAVHLHHAHQLIKKSEYYTPDWKLEICLNDGTVYPEIIETIQGRAFAWGFYNKVVLNGTLNCKDSHVELNGYKWNLTQLLAHEMIHCYQFDSLGFWRSNPVAKIPAWKWEGYPEYISRQDMDQKDLVKNIDRLNQTDLIDNNGWISFEDGTGMVIPYYKNWLLVQYCMDIKKMTYNQILADATTEENLMAQMMDWYQSQK